MYTGKAREMAMEQRTISVSEFFEKNRHLLGYDNKVKSILTIVKEAVDNSLDACDDVGILPEIYVNVKEIDNEKYEIDIADNGPGIVAEKIPHIFGRLLYGSKFHKLKQNRGQQGIGISGAVLYCQLTTGMPTEIISSIGDGKTWYFSLRIDVKNNKPIVLEKKVYNEGIWHGVRLKFFAEGVYREYKQSVLEYLKQTYIANPHTTIIFDSPFKKYEFRRSIFVVPTRTFDIKPHIHGIELGVFVRMLHETKTKNILTFLTKEFSKMGKKTAINILNSAGIEYKKKPKDISIEDAKKIIDVSKNVKIPNPTGKCLSPIGSEYLKMGLTKELNPEWIESITRKPSVYRGWPFIIEVAIAYGGLIESFKLYRFANKVPLLYQQGECAITKAVSNIKWSRYGIRIGNNNMPAEDMVIAVHIASVWVPFISESKEAIASYPTIIREIKLALQDCARKFAIFLSAKRRIEKIKKRHNLFERYAGEIAESLSALTNEKRENVLKIIKDLIKRKSGGLYDYSD